jgi:cytochrome c-type biogenesis protein CcmE
VKRYRLLAISVLGVAGLLLGILFVGNINGNLVYFLTPQEALAQRADFDEGRRFQIGGLVRDGSVETTNDGLRFIVASGPAEVPVAYRGAPAQLFQAGIGVVLEGAWDGDTFRADTMIIKHDENYRPPEDGEADEGTT